LLPLSLVVFILNAKQALQEARRLLFAIPGCARYELEACTVACNAAQEQGSALCSATHQEAAAAHRAQRLTNPVFRLSTTIFVYKILPSPALQNLAQLLQLRLYGLARRRHDGRGSGHRHCSVCMCLCRQALLSQRTDLGSGHSCPSSLARSPTRGMRPQPLQHSAERGSSRP